MVIYPHYRVPVGTYFSTLPSADRSAQILVEQIDAL
jgi:hypothetical protein